MNDFWEMFIPAVTVSIIFLTVFGFLAFTRYLRYKEKVMLAQNGLLEPEDQSKRKKPSYFNYGIVLLLVGLGFMCTLIPAALIFETEEPAFIGIVLGVLPAAVGIALLAIDHRNRRDGPEEALDDDPIPPHKG